MAWHDEDSWLTAAFSPHATTILLTLVVALGLPILLHVWLYRKVDAAQEQPTFLVLGPSGAGKTAFATLVSFLYLFILFNLSVSVLGRWLLIQVLPAARLNAILPRLHTRLPRPLVYPPSSLLHTSPPRPTIAPPATRPLSARAASSSSTHRAMANCAITPSRTSPRPAPPRPSKPSSSLSTPPP